MNVEVAWTDGVTVLQPVGRFDTLTAPLVQEELAAATQESPARVIVDLSRVDFVDSTALATLVGGMKRARQGGGDLRLCAPQPPVRMIFELTRLDKAFEIFPQAQDALAAFSARP